jgi:hypothetical protein
MAPSLVLDRDGAVDVVVKGLVLAHFQSLAKALVKASQEPELVLLVGVGVVGAYRIIFMKWCSYSSTLIAP